MAAFLQRPRLVIGCSTTLIVTWLATATAVHRNGRVVLIVLALLGWGAVLAVWRGDKQLPLGLFHAAGLLIVGVAAVRSPIGSRDLWSYLMQGRIVAVDHGSPYLHRPAAAAVIWLRRRAGARAAATLAGTVATLRIGARRSGCRHGACRARVAPTGATAFVSGVVYSGAVVAMLVVAVRRCRRYPEVKRSEMSEQAP